MQKILIKNMVCPRCIQAVRTILDDLKIEFSNIQLGEVWLKNKLSESVNTDLKNRLEADGFELLDDARKQLIEKIKTTLITLIQHSDSELHTNYSIYLAEKLGKDYRYLSSFFSSYTGMTIEKYIILLKIEKIKEYIAYDELSISEIAYKMHYSSPAHLSRQFKQVCGLTPKDYKMELNKNRKSLDQL